MGLILFSGMAAGCFVGLIVTAILGVVGAVLTTRCAKGRVLVWRYFAVAFAAVFFLLVLGVYEYPYEHVEAGGDYDIAMKNLFLQGLGYGVAPGIAALLAAFVARWSAKTIVAH